MSQHVFTYGSLMFAPVWQRVVAGSYRSTAATLAEHARFALLDQSYPGMRTQAGAEVEGVLYFDVAPADLEALDRFEGEEYARHAVTVRSAQGQDLLAQTYLFRAHERLSDRAWDPARFALQPFLDSYCRLNCGDGN